MSGTLLLFDIDGTLVRRASGEHAAALRRALHEVHGLGLDFRADVDAAGRTDGEIARLLLLAAGVPARAIDECAGDVMSQTTSFYAQMCPEDLSETLAPGIPALLESLSARDDVRLALVTGNFESVARLKLRRAGDVGRFFVTGQGGFGSDSEDRAALPEIARRRAGGAWAISSPGAMQSTNPPAGVGVPWPREHTIVIGDTPRDIACARADGVRCLAVTTGPYGAEALAGADAVAGPGELGDVLATLL